jgi:UMF1 family MFS transporter
VSRDVPSSERPDEPDIGTADAGRSYRRIVNSWAMYDWANSAFVTVIMAAVFPFFYRALAREAGLSNTSATAAWSYTNSAAMLIVALAGPLLGALADVTNRPKLLTAIFAALGASGAVGMGILGSGEWIAASVLFGVGTVGLFASLVFYDSLLPHVARAGDIDRVSARGYALGYLGGGLLLALNLAWISRPSWFWMPDRGVALRASFVSVAVWWAVFSIPFFRNVPGPRQRDHGRRERSVVAESFARLARTFRNLRQFRELAVFLVAFWIYNEGIGTVIKLAVAYGDEIGIGQNDLLIALLVTQFIGIPSAIAFGRIGPRIGTKRAILLGVVVYAIICPLAFFMKTAAHFYVLAVVVALVQGGTQALSRSLFAAMVPRRQSGEMFGFFGAGEKAAGIMGPFLFGFVAQLGGSSRWGILSVSLFFVIGAALLMRVNSEEGRRLASAIDAMSPSSSS